MCKGQLGRQDYIDERNREGGLRIEPFNEHIDLKLASYDITPTMIAMSAKCGLLETVYQKKDMSLYIKVRPGDTVLVVSNEFISVPPYMAGYRHCHQRAGGRPEHSRKQRPAGECFL